MGWVIGIGVLGIGGFIAYKVYTGASSSPLSSIVSTAEAAPGYVESLLNKDPISVTSVGKDIYGGAKSVVSTIENIF
jgi:hypothetical protein